MKQEVEDLVNLMAAVSGYDREQILTKSRKEPLSYLRYCIFYYLGHEKGWTRSAIGNEFGMDHASVTHGIKKVSEVMSIRVTYDKQVKWYEDFKNAINQKMNKKKIYISFPITGRDETERRYYANSVIARLGEILPDYEVVNPLDNKLEYSVHWSKHMAEDIKLLLGCQAIYMCHDWQWSHGCKLEHDIATSCAIPVYYEDSHWEPNNN